MSLSKFEKDVLYGRIKPTEEEIFNEFYWRNYEKPALLELLIIFAFFAFFVAVVILI